MTLAQAAALETIERPDLIGLSALAHLVYAQADLSEVVSQLTGRVGVDPLDANALMDLATLLQLTGSREQGLDLQAQALAITRLYRRRHGDGSGPVVLAFVVAGDMMANTPLDFMLQGSDIDLRLVFVEPGLPLPSDLPEHDLAFMAVGESVPNRPVLEGLAPVLAAWPRPVLNGEPARVAALTRDGVCAMFADCQSVLSPATAQVSRADLAAFAGSAPFIVRPIGSHAGVGLSRIAAPAELEAYLAERPEPEFYVSPFVDYRSPDGQFRKQRIAFISGQPFIAHMAISDHWMVHYLSAGMVESPEKRAEEAAFMAGFDTDFAARHATAFAALNAAFDLDYFAIDCAELPDGRLLLFEADVAMIVHDLDDEERFAYKKPVMRRLFRQFQALLAETAARR